MKLPLLVATALSFFCLSSLQAGDGWQTNYKTALEQAAKENKRVLLDFTGSDWCGWCVKLDKETFSQPDFKKFAGENLVLVEVDFPNNKPQSDDVKKQNKELQAQYGVEGFPTLVLLDSKGKEIARNGGYLPGGPQGFIDWVGKAK